MIQTSWLYKRGSGHHLVLSLLSVKMSTFFTSNRFNKRESYDYFRRTKRDKLMNRTDAAVA